MLYLDTSVLVAALVPEKDTARIQTWLSEQNPRHLAISRWVITEVSSALSIKIRTGEIDPAGRATALAAFSLLVTNSLNILAVSDSYFIAAARICDDHTTGLRAGDALHLAIASDKGAVLCTLDKKLAEAGLTLGVKTQLL